MIAVEFTANERRGPQAFATRALGRLEVSRRGVEATTSDAQEILEELAPAAVLRLVSPRLWSLALTARFRSPYVAATLERVERVPRPRPARGGRRAAI